MPYPAVGRALILAAGLVLATAAPAQKMYKWVDEKGVTHFSENPPADGTKATTVEPRVTPPSGPVAPPKGTNTEAWRSQEADFRKRQVERGQREQAETRERAELEQKCAEARKRLAFFEEHGTIYSRKDDGSKTYMSEAQREARINELRSDIREHCR